MARFFKFFVLVIVFLFFGLMIFGLFGFYYIIRRPLPKVNGKIKVQGLKSEVRVLRDEFGVPHIFAKDTEDLFFACGYVQAQDRLFQMDLLRRIAEGRLSEIFGDSQEVIEMDKFMRTLGLHRLAKERRELMSEESSRLMRAYSKGINEYIEQRGSNLPLEFHLLGYKPEEWKIEDSIAIGLNIGFGLTMNWQLELLRFQLARERGEEVMWKLVPKDPELGPYIIEEGWQDNSQPIKEGKAKIDKINETDLPSLEILELIKISNRLRHLSSGSKGIWASSNSWVLDGKRTESGKPILCNDPHLELISPSVWYEMHLSAPGYNVIGVSFPGTPMVILGHTKKIAWGATTTTADMEDFFIEKLNPDNPNQYLYKDHYENFKLIPEVIRIRTKDGYRQETHIVRISRHGPIMSDVKKVKTKTDEALSLCWTAKEPNDLIHSAINLPRAESFEEFARIINGLGTPIQNWVYADEDEIGYIAAGLFPIRSNSDGTFPCPGWTGEYEWQGYVPFEKLPKEHNPKRGYIITANNRVMPATATDYVISHNYCLPYRSERIHELLLSKEKLSQKDMEKTQYDHYSKQAERLVKYFIRACEEEAKTDRELALALERLKEWDYELTPDSYTSTIFFEAYKEAFELTYKDEMSEEAFKAFAGFELAYSEFDRILEKDSEIFDNIKTKELEQKEDILKQAMKNAIANLKERFGLRMSEWKWSKVHRLILMHPLGTAEQLKLFFDRMQINQGPFPVPGGWNTINNGYYAYNKDNFDVEVGPSMRHIVDFGAIDQAEIIITGGQSGQPFSPHYSDQTKLWLIGRYHPMWMDELEIRKHLKAELKLLPEE